MYIYLDIFLNQLLHILKTFSNIFYKYLPINHLEENYLRKKSYEQIENFNYIKAIEKHNFNIVKFFVIWHQIQL